MHHRIRAHAAVRGGRGRLDAVAVSTTPGAAPPEGWHGYAEAAAAGTHFEPDGAAYASDPLLLYFASGTTAQPKLVEHTHASYPAGHLSTMYWIGLQPGDVHLNISSLGWAKHAWSNVYAPWNAGATALVLGYERFSAQALMDAIGGCGASPRSARRPRCGGCSSRPTSARAT